jgi:hypothetical protein
MSDAPGCCQYRLLYFSPRPEDGEQVCVAVLLNESGRWSVEYDEKLAKMRYLARDRDPDFVRATLELMRSENLSGDQELTAFVRGIEPQFTLSDLRELLPPLEGPVKTELVKRFLYRGKLFRTLVEAEHERQLEQNMRMLITRVVPPAEAYVVSRVKAASLFGEDIAHRLRISRPISQGIIGRTRAVLVDGVDTARGTSSYVIRRANRVSYTFWQYGRASELPDLPVRAPKKIMRVGIVFDGLAHAIDLREYSLHQFRKDADLAVEAHTSVGFGELRGLVEETLHDLNL